MFDIRMGMENIGCTRLGVWFAILTLSSTLIFLYTCVRSQLTTIRALLALWTGPASCR